MKLPQKNNSLLIFVFAFTLFLFSAYSQTSAQSGTFGTGSFFSPSLALADDIVQGQIILDDLYEGVHDPTSEQVRHLQLVLREEGVYYGRTDGIFSMQTREAVEEYQRANSIPATGYVGELTRNIINERTYYTRTEEFGLVLYETKYEKLNGEHALLDTRIERTPNRMPFGVLWLFIAHMVIVLARAIQVVVVSGQKIIAGARRQKEYGEVKAASMWKLIIDVLVLGPFALVFVAILATFFTKNKQFLLEIFYFYIQTLYELNAGIQAISISKEDVLGSLQAIMWPVVVITIAFFFKKVFTYMFFSMKEFNFFGARGELVDVKTMIAKEADKEIQRRELEKRLETSSHSIESINQAVKAGGDSKQFKEVVEIARKLAEDNKALQQRLHDEIDTLANQGRAFNRRNDIESNMLPYMLQINDSISSGLQKVAVQMQAVAEETSNVLKELRTSTRHSNNNEHYGESAESNTDKERNKEE